ncbi:DEAD/DEAH box helicase family protein [Endozoicomonas sp. SESOKO1]|uniref:DEAD/DEAH box helicase family protein n=1 Tax=Endozoicomonas sp. SESOKO1 TaxID=2828742 RepID=UPI002149390C|nr:DEAD/DEAH box helicase family protein [Endozoicomonas sp. SESOKO1]
MAKTPQASFELGNAFYVHLLSFYKQNRGAIRQHYKKLTKVFLDYNDSEKRADAFLRTPQFEALEMYVFLKEFLDNQPVYKLFEAWYDSKGKFGNRSVGVQAGEGGVIQGDMLWNMSKQDYNGVFKKMKACNGGRIYSNYIFALTMGTGKTILMATCMLYDFLLARKFPKDARYIHNALVFAPDKTVLQSLREIESFDHSKVMPPEYLNVIPLKFHYLVDAGVSLNTIDGSMFNIVVSNSQKIILKKQNKESVATEQLFQSGKELYKTSPLLGEMGALLDLGEESLSSEPTEEADLVTNQRFEKLRRLDQLGIFVDEAHHAFGNKLAQDMGVKTAKNSLRKTIDELATNLKARGSQVVACYNYTGTPYVGKEVLPEVVYAYGLKQAIEKAYLKEVELNDYTTTRSKEFLKISIRDFLEKTKDRRPEGMLPKMAIFGTTIDEIQKEIRPAVEEILAEEGIPINRILVNVGDDKITTNDDIREFNRLDTPQSEKQFILLVNKGREGWNCRSLFSVALHREPKSKVFVLQATMRCLRAVGDVQETGLVYLTKQNRELLDKELQANFRVSVDDITIKKKKPPVEVRVTKPTIKVPIKRIRHKYELKEKPFAKGQKLGLQDEYDNGHFNKYKLIHTTQKGMAMPGEMNTVGKATEDLSALREQRKFSQLSLTAEIARYLNKSPLLIEGLIEETHEGFDGVLKWVNQYNDVLYDFVIPRLFGALFEVLSTREVETFEIDLVKEPPTHPGYYEIRTDPTNVVTQSSAGPLAGKSFHLDNYCFDSTPEKEFFWQMLNDNKVDKVWFTGMLTHGQSEFVIHYVDSETQTVRSYYPDFLIKKPDGSYVIIEVKGEHMLTSQNVLDKKTYAEMMSGDGDMSYVLIPSQAAKDGLFDRGFLN